MNLYDFPCEYCSGTVRQRLLESEPINHHRGIVVLERVPIGVCDVCGAQYYAAAVVKRVESILTSTDRPTRTLKVPAETY